MLLLATSRSAPLARALGEQRRRPCAPPRPPARAARPIAPARRVAHANSGGRCCAHGRSASICAASDSSVASSFGRPTSCTARGSPSAPKPAGTDAAGWPVTFQHAVVGHHAGDRVQRPQRAAALAAAPIRGGGVAVAGVSSTSWSSSTRVQPRARARASPASARSSSAGGISAAEARHPARAPFQALGVRDRARRRRGCRAGSARSAPGPRRGRSRGRARSPRARASAAARPSRRARARASRVELARARPAGTRVEKAIRSAPGRRRGGLRERHRRRRRAVHVDVDRARGDVVEQRRVGDAARQHAVDRQAVPGARARRQRDAPALGLEPEQPAPGGGDADRAGAVGAERGADEPGGDRRARCRRSSRRARAAGPTGCASRRTSPSR